MADELFALSLSQVLGKQEAWLGSVQSPASCVFLSATILIRNSIFDLKNLPDENLIMKVIYSHKKLQCQQTSIFFD